MYDLKRVDAKLQNYDDVLIKAYCLDANRNFKNIDEVINTFDINCNSQAAAMLYLEDELEKFMAEKKVDMLYYDIERPLVDVLFDMEQAGFSVDKEMIKSLSTKFTDEITKLRKEICDLAGEEFNVNSTKQ